MEGLLEGKHATSEDDHGAPQSQGSTASVDLAFCRRSTARPTPRWPRRPGPCSHAEENSVATENTGGTEIACRYPLGAPLAVPVGFHKGNGIAKTRRSGIAKTTYEVFACPAVGRARATGTSVGAKAVDPRSGSPRDAASRGSIDSVAVATISVGGQQCRPSQAW